jgi:ABC-type glycerol-3-phosphate transport system permease component
LCALWLFPTVGLFVSSFRTADQIANSGWWASLFTPERQAPAIRIEGAEDAGGWRIRHHRQPVRGRQCHHQPLGHQSRANVEAYNRRGG